jgi:glycosyltransferase involved in cell wall biosynthesis
MPTSEPVSSGGAPSGALKVTALVNTYNQAGFVEHAIESALAQELDDRYEIVIVDDCSSDGTREIIREYAADYPGLIRVFLLDQNLGRCASRARGTREALGTYVALLDGDDYWTSPHKLRKQVEFLDSRPDCAMCFHNATVTYDDGTQEPHPFYSENPTQRISDRTPQKITSLARIVVGNFILTSSVMFRNGLITEFPDWYFDARVARGFDDWALYVLTAEHGDIGYVDELLSVYRVHGGGAWSDGLSHLRDPRDLLELIWIHDAINEHLAFRYDAPIRRRTAYLAALAAGRLAREGKLEEASQYARRSRSDAPNLNGLRRRLHLEVLARPRLASLALAVLSRAGRAASLRRRVLGRLVR